MARVADDEDGGLAALEGLLAWILGFAAAAQGADGAASRPVAAAPARQVSSIETRPAVVSTSGFAAPAPAKPASSPAKATSVAAKLAALLAKADSDANYATCDLEASILALGSAVLPDLEAAYRARPGGSTASALARALGKTAGIKAIPTFHALARSEDTDARVAVARGLETIAHKSAVDELVALLDDHAGAVIHATEDALVSLEHGKLKVGVRGTLERRLGSSTVPNASKVSAAHCLSRIADPDSARAFLVGLDEHDPDLRAACVEGIGHLPTAAPEAGPKLVELLEDPDLDVRRQTILALGRLRVLDACPPLIELLESEDRSLQSSALWALRAISGHAFPDSPDRWKEWWKREEARVKEAKEKAEREEPDEKNP
jgi:HEAT repeat protein